MEEGECRNGLLEELVPKLRLKGFSERGEEGAYPRESMKRYLDGRHHIVFWEQLRCQFEWNIKCMKESNRKCLEDRSERLRLEIKWI